MFGGKEMDEMQIDDLDLLEHGPTRLRARNIPVSMTNLGEILAYFLRSHSSDLVLKGIVTIGLVTILLSLKLRLSRNLEQLCLVVCLALLYPKPFVQAVLQNRNKNQ